MSKESELKNNALALVTEKINKTYGKGTIMKLGDAPVEDVDSINLNPSFSEAILPA